MTSREAKNAVLRRLLLSMLLVLAFSFSCTTGDRDHSSTLEQTVSAQPDPSCESVSHDGHQYWTCARFASFQDAHEKCANVGAELARVDDPIENAFLAERLQHSGWLGASSPGEDGGWEWLAGSKQFWAGGLSGGPVAGSYSNWAVREPHDAAGHGCAIMNAPSGEWEPASCARAAPYVCEVGASVPPPPQAPDEQCSRLVREGHEYWLCRDARSFDEARGRCQTVGLDLATVDSAPEDAFLASALNSDAFIGLRDATGSGIYKWVSDGTVGWCGGRNGRTPTSADYANWQPSFQGPTAGDGICAAIRRSNSRWAGVGCQEQRGYICETVDANADQTLDQVAVHVRDQYQTGKPRVGHVQFRPESAVTEPFSRYLERLGLRECSDALEPGTAQDVPYTGLRAIDYRQTYQGVPVFTRGYSVLSDATTGSVVSVHGRVEHDIETATAASLSEASAFQEAVAAIGADPSDFDASARDGQLFIFPTTQGPNPDFELAWYFTLHPEDGSEGHSVAVSAIDGEVVSIMSSWKRQCSSADTTSGYTATELEITAFQQEEFGDPATAAGGYLGATAPLPYVLTTGGVKLPNGDMSNAPILKATCEGEDFVHVTALPASAISIDETSPVSHHAAGMFMASQRCLEFLAADFEVTPGNPWLGFDGTGARLVDLVMNDSAAGPFFRPSDFTVHFGSTYQPFLGAAIETACHELVHGIWATLVPDREDMETASLNEGFSDVLSGAAEMRVRGHTDDGGFCYRGDHNRNATCIRDFRNPEESESSACTVVDASGNLVYERCPRDYGGPDYCTFSVNCQVDDNVDCCWAHQNSTILSHWFYILSVGDEGINSLSCPFKVEPIADDREQAVTKTVQVLFAGIRDQLFADNTGFEGLADATLGAAIGLYGIDSREAKAVSNAWHAVNVRENFFEAYDDAVNPPRSAFDVHPWMTFTWPIQPEETSWDFQIANGPFDNGAAVLFEASDVTTTHEYATETAGALALALPFGSTDTFFWRTRPHSEEAWSNCYPIHQFVGTGVPASVTFAEFTGRFADGETEDPLPGSAALRFNAVPGASFYRVSADTEDSDCEPGPDAIQATGHHEDGAEFGTTSLRGLQPEEHYVLNIQPVGPRGFDGELSTGECFKMDFETAAMRAPIFTNTSEPVDDAAFDFHGPGPSFRWTGLDGPSQFRVEFFEIGAGGFCELDPAITEIVTEDFCSGESCTGTLGEGFLDTPPNGSGYCWDVTSIAANGKESPTSESRRFYYVHDNLTNPAPGEEIGRTEIYRVPAPLGHDSYGKDVTFSWDAEADAFQYEVKVGRWPWNVTSDTPDPAHCAGLSGEGGELVQSTYSCMDEPVEETFRDVVGTNFVVVPGDSASKGRYCWAVWPIIEDPVDNGRPWTRQPFVSLHPLYCYTSGPAKPRIEIDDAPPERGFTGDTIRGRIVLDYVPDRQYEFVGSSDAVVFGERCPTEGLYFADTYDCEIPFSIEPEEGQDYKVTARTWSSSEFPQPVADEDSLAWEVDETISTGVCGGKDEACCAEEACDEDDLVCKDEDCVSCGEVSQPCCADDKCANFFRICQEGVCEYCGSEGEPCCGRPGQYNRCPEEISQCLGETCVHCGDVGEPCCWAIARDYPGQCSEGNHCVDAVVDDEGDLVSPGTCHPMPGCDGEKVTLGYNDPRSVEVNLGSVRDDVQVLVDTINVADTIIVRHPDIPGGEYVFDCISTFDPEVQELPNYDCNGQRCCDGLDCWYTFQYSGSGVPVTVEVLPDCAETEYETVWAFKVGCPGTLVKPFKKN